MEGHFFPIGIENPLNRIRDITPYNERKYICPFTYYNDTDFKARFRFSKETVSFLERLLEGKIAAKCGRNGAYASKDRILMALNYYANGSYQYILADTMHTSQATVSRMVRRVTDALLDFNDTFISFSTDEEQLKTISRCFETLAGIYIYVILKN